jgi:hypothetical protein
LHPLYFRQKCGEKWLASFWSSRIVCVWQHPFPVFEVSLRLCLEFGLEVWYYFKLDHYFLLTQEFSCDSSLALTISHSFVHIWESSFTSKTSTYQPII